MKTKITEMFTKCMFRSYNLYRDNIFDKKKFIGFSMKALSQHIRLVQTDESIFLNQKWILQKRIEAWLANLIRSCFVMEAEGVSQPSESVML